MLLVFIFLEESLQKDKFFNLIWIPSNYKQSKFSPRQNKFSLCKYYKRKHNYFIIIAISLSFKL